MDVPVTPTRESFPASGSSPRPINRTLSRRGPSTRTSSADAHEHVHLGIPCCIMPPSVSHTPSVSYAKGPRGWVGLGAAGRWLVFQARWTTWDLFFSLGGISVDARARDESPWVLSHLGIHRETCAHRHFLKHGVGVTCWASPMDALTIDDCFPFGARVLIVHSGLCSSVR
jgi:hypothetical protein